MKGILFFYISLLFIVVNAYSQGYDKGFAKPIVTENGSFVYYELPPIQTSEGILIFG